MHDKDGGEIPEGTNEKRALELLEKLYKLTNESYYLKAQFDRFILKSEDYKAAVEKYKAIPESELDEDDFIRIAELSLMIGDYSEADRYFEKVYELKKNVTHYDLMPVVLNIYLGDMEDSLRFLSILDVWLYKIDKEELYSDISKLKDIDKTTSEYKKFQDALKVLIDSRADRNYKQKFKDIYEDIQNPLLHDILKNAGGYYSVFDIY
jgi:tetratricopeptide (TPR) repeat protein